MALWDAFVTEKSSSGGSAVREGGLFGLAFRILLDRSEPSKMRAGAAHLLVNLTACMKDVSNQVSKLSVHRPLCFQHVDQLYAFGAIAGLMLKLTVMVNTNHKKLSPLEYEF